MTTPKPSYQPTAEPDLIVSAPASEHGWRLPGTWCVVACEQGCHASWTVDAADFDPQLTVQGVEELLTPLLLAHERDEHGR